MHLYELLLAFFILIIFFIIVGILSSALLVACHGPNIKYNTLEIISDSHSPSEIYELNQEKYD